MNTLRTHAPRLLAGFGTAALVTGVGLFASSRPARTAGGPVPVTVTNTVPVTALAPLPTTSADAPAKQGVQSSAEFLLSGSDDFVTQDMYTVPPGKRLVIETVSAFNNNNGSNDKHHYSIFYQCTGGLGNELAYGSFAMVPNGSPLESGESHPHQYADDGSHFYIQLDRAEASGVSDAVITFTGYLVDISGPGGS